MKKSILAVAVVLGSTSLFAQDLTSKKGEAYLPEAGDYAISIDATPFLNYFGNFFGKTAANAAPTWNYLTNNQTITGKYFVDAETAYRASLRIGFGSNKGSAMIGQTGATAPVYPALATEVEDTYKMGNTNIGLAVGMEKRRGFGRLQGFYGAELGFSIASTKETYTYGNAIVAADNNVAGITSNFGANMVVDSYGFDARVLENKSGTTFGFGLRGFIGAEYFVLPRLAVGGEFGWGLGFSSTGAGTMSTESTDGVAIGTQDIETTKMSSFGIDSDDINGVFGPAANLRITLHF